MLSIHLTLTGPLGAFLVLAIILSLKYTTFVFHNALNRIPNAHWSSSLSSLWILWIRYHNLERSVLEEKHRNLGPIVRVGPSDLSISCYENGIKTIYNGGFEKPPYYNFFAYYGRKNSFCSMSRHDHSLRRKRVTAAHSRSSLFSSHSLSSLTQDILVGRLLPILDSQSLSNEPLDILPLSYGLSLDLLTSFQFGLASGSNFLQNPAKLSEWLEHYEKRYCKAAFWPQELPNLTSFLKVIGIDMLPKTQYESTRYLEDWLLDICDQADTVRLAAENGTSIQPKDMPVIYSHVKRAVEADIPEASADAKRREVASELFDHMCKYNHPFHQFSSTDQVKLVDARCLVLAYTIYYISQDTNAQKQLRSELATIQPKIRRPEPFTRSSLQDSQLPAPESLDRLPYLSAVLRESFRMRPNSTPLPRVTPRDRTVSLAGIDDIPPETRVNAFQWFIHRNPENYDHVNEWYPERWLERHSKDSKNSLLWAFGGGSRMCLGVSLTQYLMRYILATIYSNYSSSITFKENGPHEPGSPEDRILIRFEPLPNILSSSAS